MSKAAMASNIHQASIDAFISKHRRLLNGLLVCLGILVMLTEDHSWLQRLGDDEVLTVAGWMLVAAGIVVRYWAALYLGGHKNRHLITSGPYALVRNPLYAGNLIAGAGLVILSESPVAGLLVITGLAVIFLATIRYEERRLSKKFGQDYQAYRQQVPMLAPRWGNIRQLLYSQDVHQISYQNIRREIVRSIWLVAAAIGLHFGAEMLEHLPTMHPLILDFVSSAVWGVC